MSDTLNIVTSILDLYSVIFALAIAPGWLPRLYPGKNPYELGKNREAIKAHRVWTAFYLGAAVSAALSGFIKIDTYAHWGWVAYFASPVASMIRSSVEYLSSFI